MSDFKGKSDAGEIREILDAVGDKVPKLIKELMGSLYSREAGTNMGQSVGAFYKELVDAGIPAKDALEMSKSYLFSLKDVMKQGSHMHGNHTQDSQNGGTGDASGGDEV